MNSITKFKRVIRQVAFALFFNLLFISFLGAETWGNIKGKVTKRRKIDPFRVQLLSNDTKVLEHLIRSGVIFDHYNGEERIAFLDVQDLRFLDKNNFAYLLLPKEQRGKNRENYYTHTALSEKLRQFESAHPQLVKLHSIGMSHEKRELWAVKISDHVLVDEAEPEVKLVSTMHGDEIVGQEMMVRLIHELLSGYENDERITSLVNSTEIWIVPNLNPDGTVAGTRYNANYVDLNRDFPDTVSGDSENTPAGRAFETQSMMKFTKEHRFSLSANFHGGALVVNFPWDSMSQQMPDYAMARLVSEEYARLNEPMSQSSYFPDGITNGYNWYPIYGGMQDWNYIFHDCLDVTVEIYGIKWPAYSKVDSIWLDNRDSLLRYIEMVHMGVHGFVVDAETGEPIQAEIKVGGIEKVMESLIDC